MGRTQLQLASRKLARGCEPSYRKSYSSLVSLFSYPLSTIEEFLWDGLALICRGDEHFVNEPHVGNAPKKLRFEGKPRAQRSARRARKGPRGNPVVSSKGVSYFNDMLGTTVGFKSNGKYSAAALSAFGERLDNVDSTSPAIRSLGEGWFTGKPYIEGLGHAFLFRNYRASLAKWQTADPLGYPDGWNQLAYCNNRAASSVDLLGCRCTNDDTEFIWHEYQDPTFFTCNNCIYPLDHPTIPTSTDPKRVMDTIRSLKGMTVTFDEKKDVYSSTWEFSKTYDEVTLGNYECKKELYLTYKITKTCHYAYYSKSSLLSSLAAGCTTVGAVAVIVSILLPEIAIPAEVVGNGASVVGFLAWLNGAMSGNDCKTLIFTEYNGAWTDDAKVEYLHRRIE